MLHSSARVAPERRAFPACLPMLHRDATREVVTVSRKDAEAELERVLAGLPSFERKLLDYSVLSDAENEEWTRADWWWTPPGDAPIRARYEELLRQVPEKWREYKKNLLAFHRSLVPIPAGKPGRPRKDEEAEQLAKEHESKSYKRIAKARLTTAGLLPSDFSPEQKELAIFQESERIRKLVGSRKPKSHRRKSD